MSQLLLKTYFCISVNFLQVIRKFKVYVITCIHHQITTVKSWEINILCIDNWQPGRKFCCGRQPNRIKIGLLGWPLLYSNFDGIRATHFLHYRLSLISRRRPLGHTQYAKKQPQQSMCVPMSPKTNIGINIRQVFYVDYTATYIYFHVF